MRDAQFDWSKDTPMEVHIEALDRPAAAPITFDETELAARIDRAAKWSRASFAYAMSGIDPYFSETAPRERNRFYASTEGRQQGGNPLGFWTTMFYDIGPDEALIFETPDISARYWGYQLGSAFGETTDYSYHQSSLNLTQLRRDADGKFRVILSLRDPGVPNWLDPAGAPVGLALLRIYEGDGDVDPVVTRVKLSELRHYLPPGTPFVTPAERQAALTARRRAALSRFGQ